MILMQKPLLKQCNRHRRAALSAEPPFRAIPVAIGRRTPAKVNDTATPLPFREGMRYGRQQGLFRSEPRYAGESDGERVSYNNRLLLFREETAVARIRSALYV
jgi:hypothetical protein